MAIILPTYLGWELLEQWNLVPGAVLAVRARIGSCLVVFWSIYLRPGGQLDTLRRLAALVTLRRPLWEVDRQIILGDLNLARGENSEANTLLEELLDTWGAYPTAKRSTQDY